MILLNQFAYSLYAPYCNGIPSLIWSMENAVSQLHPVVMWKHHSKIYCARQFRPIKCWSKLLGGKNLKALDRIHTDFAGSGKDRPNPALFPRFSRDSSFPLPEGHPA